MIRQVALAAGLLAVTGLAHAQATVKPDGQMRSAIGIGASLSSGNTKSSNLTIAGEAVRATAQDKTTLYGSLQNARSAGTTTADQLRLGGRYDYNLGPAWFAFGGLDLERNKFANLKLRNQLSGGLGYHAIKTPTTTWDLFAGVGLTGDMYIAATLIDGATRSSYSYTSLLLAEESTHKLSDTTSFKQRLALFPNLKNSGEFRATFDAGLAVAMSKSMNLNVGLGIVHNSEPGAGRKATDSLLTTGVSVKFD
jgi:putative salt-induced outer membrane protein YdiY